MVTKLDFVAVPSQDAERTRAFYVDTLGLRPDVRSRFEFWAGETCFAIWEPAQYDMAFFADPDGNNLMLHCRYAPLEDDRAAS